MTTLKLDGSPSSAALTAMEAHVPGLYGVPSRRLMVVAELAHVERVVPGPDSDKEPSVKVRIALAEPAVGDHADTLREVMRALHLSRTARGTLTEDLDVQVAEQTLARAADVVVLAETARLAAGVDAWRDYAGAALTRPKATAADLRKDLQAIRDGLRALAVNVETGEIQ